MKTSKSTINKDRVYSSNKKEKNNYLSEAIGLIIIVSLITFLIVLIDNNDKEKEKENIELFIEKDMKLNNSNVLLLSENSSKVRKVESRSNSFNDLMKEAEIIKESDSDGNLVAVGWKYRSLNKNYEAIFKIDKFGVKYETIKMFVSPNITIIFDDFNLNSNPVIESDRCKINCSYFFNTPDNTEKYMNMRNLSVDLLSEKSVTLNEVEDGDILEKYTIPKLDGNYSLIQSTLSIPKIVANQDFWNLISQMKE